MTTPKMRRRPVEAIEHRTRRSIDCERRVRAALVKLVRTGAPFTVENVCALSGVGKTFIYDKRRPDLMNAVLTARDAAQAKSSSRGTKLLADQQVSWRERTLNAEALAKQLRDVLKEREARIGDLTGQLFDPNGAYLAEQNAELRQMVSSLHQGLRSAEAEIGKLRRSLDGARANVKRERERNVAQLFPNN
jgi:hypothetical protein